MFFSKTGPTAPQTSAGSRQTDSQQDRRPLHRRRPLATIALAVALALPAGVSLCVYVTAAHAQATQAQNPSEALQLGIKQYKAGEYENAVATLEAINADALAASNKSMLNDVLPKAREALTQRKGAVGEFDAGEKALQEGNATDAATHYRNAAANKFADSGTKQKAAEQLALAQSLVEQKQGDLKATYRDAVADYKAGRVAEAKQKFETLAAANFNPGVLDKSPADYLKEINSRAATPPPAAAVVAAPPGGVSPAPVAPAPRPAPIPAPLAPAPSALAPTPPTAPPPVAAQPTPVPTPGAVAARPAPPPAPTNYQPPPPPTNYQTQPAQPPQPPAPRPDIYENTGPEQPVVSRASAKELYKLAKDQYSKGDWIAARKNFMAAQAAGYKPGFLEDPPSKYLERMDKKEQADAAKHAEQLQREQSAQARAANPPPAPAVAVVPQPPTNSQPPAYSPPPAPPGPPAGYQPAPAPAYQPPTAPPPAPAVIQPPAQPPAPVYQPPTAPPAPAPVYQPPTAPPAPAPVYQPPTAPPAPAPVYQPPTAPPAPAPVYQPPTAPAAQPPTAPPAQPPAYQPPAYQPPPAQQYAAPPVAPATTPQQQLAESASVENVRKTQQVAEARKVVEQAQAAQREQRFADALQMYTRALELDPNNQVAQAGRNDMLRVTGRATANSPLTDVERRVRLARQEISYNFEQAMTDLRDAIARSEFGAAHEALNRAQVARNQNPNVFTADEIRSFDSRLSNARTNLNANEEDFRRRTTLREQEEAQRTVIETQRVYREQQRRTVADLTANARNLINETRYQEALGVIDQILVIDPTNDYATGVRPLVEDKALIQEQRRYREDFDRNFTKQLVASEEKKIPYDDILRYPTNWPDISELRDQTTANERGLGTADAATQVQLNKQLPELRWDAIPFADVIDFLRDVSGANIFVNWRALEQAGIDKNTPVTARLHDVKFSKALQTILSDVGGGTVKLGYTVDEGVITISTEEDLSRNTLTRVYDIRDLIVDVPDFPGPVVNVSNVGQGGGGGRVQSSGGGNLFAGGGGEGESNVQTQPKTRQQLVDDITKLIQETVAPDSWREAGGTVGSVRELGGQLIVTQTPENQRQLQGLLEQLREQRAIQITIETRFLTVQRNFLEDIGFDIDLVLNPPGERGPNSKWSTIPITQSSIVYTANPATGLPGSIRNINNGTVTQENNGLGLASLALSGTYLDNFAVQFLIRATQAAQSSTLLTAPRLTLFNGQRAYVIVARYTAYVSDLDAVVAQNAVAFNPRISTIPSGVVLDVQATVSADRKYVTLTLRPTLITLLDLVPFTFQQAAPTGATTLPTGGGTIFLGGGTNNPTGTIQAPIYQVTAVRTTVSVPDGGTLLLGGQTLAGEIEREAGIPVLSKIPFLKRLFTNRSMAKDEQVLLILVKPTIVIEREQEQRQFPLLSTKVAG